MSATTTVSAPSYAAAATSTDTTPSTTPSTTTNTTTESNDLPNNDKQSTSHSLAPAPLPATNPWGNVSNRQPPSVDLSQIIHSSPLNSNSNSSTNTNQNINSSTTTPPPSSAKWVPFKGANISFSNNNSSSTSSNNKRKQKKLQNNKKKSTSIPSPSPSSTSSSSPDLNKKQSFQSNTQTIYNKSQKKLHSSSSSSSNTTTTTTTTTSSSDINPIQNQSDNIPTDNFINKKFTSQRQSNPKHIQSNSQNKNFNTNNNRNRKFNHHNHNNNQHQPHHHHHHHHHHQQQHQQLNWITPENRIAAVKSVAYQLDYYFDISNLLKDVYLRKHMNNNGWLDLEFVSQFFRVRALSFGDLSVIKDALKFTKNLQYGFTILEDPTNPIKNIKIRPLINFNNWILPIDERQGCGLDNNDPIKIELVTPIPASISTSTPTTTPVQIHDSTSDA